MGTRVWLFTIDGNPSGSFTSESLRFRLRGSDWCFTGSDSLFLVKCLSKAIRKCSLWPENDWLWWHDIPFPWSTSIRLLWWAEWAMFQSQESFISVGWNLHWKHFQSTAVLVISWNSTRWRSCDRQHPRPTCDTLSRMDTVQMREICKYWSSWCSHSLRAYWMWCHRCCTADLKGILMFLSADALSLSRRMGQGTFIQGYLLSLPFFNLSKDLCHSGWGFWGRLDMVQWKWLHFQLRDNGVVALHIYWVRFTVGGLFCILLIYLPTYGDSLHFLLGGNCWV